jgi:hypothetical protein
MTPTPGAGVVNRLSDSPIRKLNLWFICPPPLPAAREKRGSRPHFYSPSTRRLLEVGMTTMRSLAIMALVTGGTLPALSQNAPPSNGYPPPAAGASGTPATYGPPAPGVIPVAPGPIYSHHYRHSHRYIVVPLTRRYGYQPYWWPQASGICLPLAAWNAVEKGNCLMLHPCRAISWT